MRSEAELSLHPCLHTGGTLNPTWKVSRTEAEKIDPAPDKRAQHSRCASTQPVVWKWSVPPDPHDESGCALYFSFAVVRQSRGRKYAWLHDSKVKGHKDATQNEKKKLVKNQYCLMLIIGEQETLGLCLKSYGARPYIVQWTLISHIYRYKRWYDIPLIVVITCIYLFYLLVSTPCCTT